VTYWEMCPISIDASPLLALFEGRDREADTLLKFRSRQVWDLLRDNVRLSVRVQEAELQGAARSGNGVAPLAAPVARPAAPAPRLVSEGDVDWLAAESSGRLISLVLPVRDRGADLRELLPRLLRQRGRDQIELVAVDFGSADDTLDLLCRHHATIVAAG